MERGLSAYEFRAICTAIFGPKYHYEAALALGVRDSRVRYWGDPAQDDSIHASGFGVRRELEELFIKSAQSDKAVIERVDAMGDAIDYLDRLWERAF